MEKVSIKENLLRELENVNLLIKALTEKESYEQVISLHQTKVMILTALQKYEAEYAKVESQFVYFEKGDK